MKIPTWFWLGVGALGLWYLSRKATATRIDTLAAGASAAAPVALNTGALTGPSPADLQAIANLPQLNFASASGATSVPADAATTSAGSPPSFAEMFPGGA